MGMPAPSAAHLAELTRLGRAREFDTAAFEEALSSAGDEGARLLLLRELILEWTGIAVVEDEVPGLWSEVAQVREAVEQATGERASLQTALLHVCHTRRGLLREPRILPGRELEALRVNAITDPLTGLYNRRFLYDHLGRELSRADRMGGVVSVVMMDLQGFKEINDQLGHPVGDTMLVRTARVIRESLRAVDAGCRFGGDEFVAVLPNSGFVGSLAVAERIRQRVTKIQLPRRIGVRMGLHYGVASFPSDGRTVDFLVKMVDQRLYDCRRYNADPRTRRHPRFNVPGLKLRLTRGGRLKDHEYEVKDIGHGGLAFIAPAVTAPQDLEGELHQDYTSDAQHVAMRRVNVQALSDGRARFGCAYVH
jgi:diguanylate cyclase (GGDEF)-like protein